jgi:hypothetical protein
MHIGDKERGRKRRKLAMDFLLNLKLSCTVNDEVFFYANKVSDVETSLKSLDLGGLLSCLVPCWLGRGKKTFLRMKTDALRCLK